MSLAESTEANLRHWDSIFRSRPWGRYPAEEVIRFIARNFFRAADRRAVRLLEVGCGPGANVWFMAREGFSVSAIDGSPAAIEQLAARLTAEGIAFDPAEFRTGNFATLPWPDETFDAVVDVEALSANRLDVVHEALGEIRRVMKPGAVLFSKMFSPQTTGCGTGEQLEERTTADPETGACAGIGTVHFFTEADLDAVFAPFHDVARSWVHRREADGTEVHEWITTARK